MVKADLTSEEVSTPAGRWCSSGHVATEHWAKEGAGTPLVPTLFYQISSRDGSVNGTYCEMCLIVANAMAAKKKMEIRRNGSSR